MTGCVQYRRRLFSWTKLKIEDEENLWLRLWNINPLLFWWWAEQLVYKNTKAPSAGKRGLSPAPIIAMELYCYNTMLTIPGGYIYTSIIFQNSNIDVCWVWSRLGGQLQRLLYLPLAPLLYCVCVPGSSNMGGDLAWVQVSDLLRHAVPRSTCGSSRAGKHLTP